MMEQQSSSSSYQNNNESNGNDGQSNISDGESTTSLITNQQTKPSSSCPWLKIFLGLLLLSTIIFVIVDSLTNKYIVAGFQNFLQWIESNILAGVFAFVAVYFVATVMFVPGSILTLGSGFVFGKAVGLGPGVALATAAVFVGASLGAIVA